MTPVEQYDPIITTAAMSMAVCLRRLGWDADDCKQEARLALLTQPKFWDTVAALPDADARARMVYVAARRAIIKASRTYRARLGVATSVAASWLEEVEGRVGMGATVELADLVMSAPPNIARYLRCRVLDGMTWDETRDAMEVNNARLATIRTEAASWLLTQMEPRDDIPMSGM